MVAVPITNGAQLAADFVEALGVVLPSELMKNPAPPPEPGTDAVACHCCR
jgi:hypothetical protein